MDQLNEQTVAVDGETAGFASLVGSSSPLRRHWATVLRVQVHPSRQGGGLGGALMAGVHDIAREIGWEFVYLTARGRRDPNKGAATGQQPTELEQRKQDPPTAA